MIHLVVKNESVIKAFLKEHAVWKKNQVMF